MTEIEAEKTNFKMIEKEESQISNFKSQILKEGS
jgi:hypothetical protein